MANVVIQPSFGNPDARRHWRDTLDQQIDFRVDPLAAALTHSERVALDLVHPDGTARFWGATGNQDSQMEKLGVGDVVLFTGAKMVRAVGEVGFSFRNERAANALWDPHPERGSYRNVYSLLNFQTTEIPYEEIWDLPGFNHGDNFMGLRFLDATKADVLLEGLGIETATDSASAEGSDAGAVLDSVRSGHIVPPEAMNVTRTEYLRLAGKVLVNRTEAMLVKRYRATLGEFDVNRIRTSVGLTDLYVVGSEWREIVEAKSGADHDYVRQALGQLLDYVVHGSETIDHLSALFPARPADFDVRWLHRFGIDCVYEAEPDVFERASAPDERRGLMAGIWSDED